jgi:hypothetical protein
LVRELRWILEVNINLFIKERRKKMKIAALYHLACMAYKMILRGVLKSAIDDPDQEWDDWVLSFCDKLFNYEE